MECENNNFFSHIFNSDEPLDEPCSLPCQHHFCRECLDDHGDGRSETLGPTCRVPYWSGDVRTNLALRNILQAVVQAARAVRIFAGERAPNRTGDAGNIEALLTEVRRSK